MIIEDEIVREKTEEESFDDGVLLAKIVIPSSPATKKNSSRIIKNKGFFKIIPSERFMSYQSFCKPYMNAIRKDKNLPPIDFGITVKIRVATDKWIVPDYTNVCQAIGDILQSHNVITNDKWIHWTDGNGTNDVPSEHWFIGVDKENPRLEMEIRRFRHPLEEYRNEKEAKLLKKQEKKRNKSHE
jgi:hypothetical protein